MLKINNPATGAPSSELSDVVGRFRSGYQINGEPASLGAFRITTGDPTLAASLAAEFGVDKTKAEGPQEWEAAGEDYIEVFTEASTVNIILESADAYKSSLVRRAGDGSFMYATDGAIITAVGEDFDDEYKVGDADPQSGQDLDSRKIKAKKKLGSSPDIRVTFTIEGHADWGVFQFRSGGWSLVHNDPEEKLSRMPEGPIKCQLKLTTVEGKKFTWTKPELIVRGSAIEGTVQNLKPALKNTEPPF
jgi:hypothetical protein